LEAEPAETRQVRRRHLLAIVLAELAPILAAHAAEVEPKQHPNDILLTALCKEIGKHVSEPISLDELARRHFISRAKLDRLFVDALGMPPGRYLLNIRLSRACIDLRAGLSVQETAARCGYTNVGHFIRLFRRYTGVTPAKFRRGE
jgi:AraC-like DNA-binding protein